IPSGSWSLRYSYRSAFGAGSAVQTGAPVKRSKHTSNPSHRFMKNPLAENRPSLNLPCRSRTPAIIIRRQSECSQEVNGMQRNSTVLVTGSAGRIGRAVVAELLARNWPVRGFDRVRTPGVEDSVVGDLTDAAIVQQAAKGVSALVHLAATPDDDDF